jgi:hypothetical protein
MTNVEEKVQEVAVQEEAEKKQYEVADKKVEGLELDLTDFGFSKEELADLSGLDELNPTDITIPYATMIKKSKKGYKLGDFEFADGTKVELGDEKTTIDNISILQMMNVRVMFPAEFDPANSFDCRSLDGKVGAPGAKYEGRDCGTCEFAKYPEKGGASPCRDQRLLLCAREDGSLFHLQVHGVDIKEWKMFMSSQVMHLLPKVKKKIGVELLGALKISIGCKMTETTYGDFPALQFKINPDDAFMSNEAIVRNVGSLRSYKQFFQQESLESAAHQTQANIANGGDIVSEQGNGQNSNLF